MILLSYLLIIVSIVSLMVGLYLRRKGVQQHRLLLIAGTVLFLTGIGILAVFVLSFG